MERLEQTRTDSDRLGQTRKDSDRLGQTRTDSERPGETRRDCHRHRAALDRAAAPAPRPAPGRPAPDSLPASETCHRPCCTNLYAHATPPSAQMAERCAHKHFRNRPCASVAACAQAPWCWSRCCELVTVLVTVLWSRCCELVTVLVTVLWAGHGTNVCHRWLGLTSVHDSAIAVSCGFLRLVAACCGLLLLAAACCCLLQLFAACCDAVGSLT